MVITIGMIFSAQAQKLELGTSSAVIKVPTTQNFRALKSCGIDYVEVAINQCYRGVPKHEILPRIDAMQAAIDSAELKVWSIHLPFSKTLDISVLDKKKRKDNVDFIAMIIRKCAIFSPQRLVLHSSSEPIADSVRAERIANAVESIKLLKPITDEIGAILCIENLPRTCIGNTPEELVSIVDEVDGVGICFDTNHYFLGDTDNFLKVAGSRIKTLHCSDYDYKQECHWLPTQGDIPWAKLMSDLEAMGYDGVFMYEAIKDRDTGKVLTPRQIADSFAKIKNLKN